MGRKTWTMILGLAMLVAGCGGGNDDATSEPTEGDTGTTAQTDDGGDTSSEETTTTASSDADTGDSDSPEFAFETGDGYFEVDGERYEAQVIRCIPEESGTRVIGVASRSEVFEVESSTAVEGPGGDANYEATRLSSSLSLSGDDGLIQFETHGLSTAPDGNWYVGLPIQLALSTAESEQLEDPPIVVDGSDVSGTVQLEQTWPEGATGTPLVTYEFSLPGEEVDCDAF